jgi:ParB family chromosome partitioning protein
MDELMRTAGANIDESMGGGDSPRIASPTSAAPARYRGVVKAKDVAQIQVDRIVRDPGQPREEFDEDALRRLADSLRIRGQLQPIRVRWDETQGAYMILVGERRWRAAQVAGLASLSCVIEEKSIGPDELLAIQLVENALREDLKPVEQGRAYRRLMDAHGWTSRQVAEELQVGQASVVRALALLDLPTSVQEQVETGRLPASTAYEIGQLDGPELQAELASQAVESKLTRSEVAAAVKAVKSRRPAPEPKPAPVEIDLGDGLTVLVRYRKPSGVSPLQALRRAVRELQDRERSEERAA